MAKQINTISYMPAVERVSRKFVPRHTKCTIVEATAGKLPVARYMGGASTQGYVIGHGSFIKNYMFFRQFARTSQPNETELANRQRFTNANAWVRAAYRDLNAISTNQLRFREAAADSSKTIEHVSAFGYTGMRGWMRGVAYALLKAEKELPANHILPEFDA